MSQDQLQGRNAIRHRAAYDRPRPDHPEAIAMRRIVVEMGEWLSPLLKDHPIPVLTEWEATVDLTALQVSWKKIADAKRERIRPEALGRSGRERSYSTPSLREVEAKRSRNPTKADFAEAERLPLPKPAPKPARVSLAPPSGGKWLPLKSTAAPPPPRDREPMRPAVKVDHTPESRANAIARISALAEAKRAEEEAKAAARDARRAETAKAANRAYASRHAERMATDPAYAEAHRAKCRAKDAVKYAERKAAKEARMAANRTPEAISARKRREYEQRRALHLKRMANDPTYAEAYRAKQREKARRQTEAARKALASLPPMPTAKELVAEARRVAGLE